LGTKARTETSRFKTLPRASSVAVNRRQNTLLSAAWLSIPRDRGLSAFLSSKQSQPDIVARGFYLIFEC
jgi:hypothetical protein